MSAQILAFKPRKRPGRIQAMRWLAINSVEFPKGMDKGVGPGIFFSWRFIQAADGVMYFANCIHPGITEEDVLQFGRLRVPVVKD